MASGAPRPGGFHAPAPGGLHAPAAGGIDLNDDTVRAMLAGYPDFDIDPPGDASGGLTKQTRSVVNLRQGRASGSVTYAWTLPTKPATSTATVTGGSTATASFTPDLAGGYVLQIKVTFSDGTAITKSVAYVAA